MTSIKAIKLWVKFGISPFGIVENKFAGTNGLDSYNVLYCDPVTWLKNKTVDYILPQLYWEIGSKAGRLCKPAPLVVIFGRGKTGLRGNFLNKDGSAVL